MRKIQKKKISNYSDMEILEAQKDLFLHTDVGSCNYGILIMKSRIDAGPETVGLVGEEINLL